MLKTTRYTSVTSSSLAGRKRKRVLILICLWMFWLFRIIDMSLETISDHFPLNAEACCGKQSPGLAAVLSPAELCIQAVHSSNRCFCFLRSVGTSLNVFFIVGANASIAEIQQFDLRFMLLLENTVTGYPIVHIQEISCWLLILHLLFRAQFLCLLFSYFLAINRGAHNHCCLQCKGIWGINLALKALGKLKISLLVAETMHSLHLVRAVSSHLVNYIKGIGFKSFLCNSTLGAQRQVSQKSELCLLKLR